MTHTAGSSLSFASASLWLSAVITWKSSPLKVISSTLRIVTLSSTASRVLATSRLLKNAASPEFLDDCAEFGTPKSSTGSRAPKRRRIPAGCAYRGGPVTEKIVTTELARHPIDAAVRALYGVSWGEARRWIERGKITVDGEAWTDPRKKVREGARLVLTMNAPKPRPATDLPAGAIVFFDAHVVVVNKPSGISTVPFDESETGTLDERVRAALSRMDKKGDRNGRPTLGVVHRIDKETSGLVVFTRTWLAKKSLAAQFREHTVHRRYYAIAHGDVVGRTIRSHIVPNRGDGLRGSRAKGDEGQLAITHVEVVEKLKGATLIACR